MGITQSKDHAELIDNLISDKCLSDRHVQLVMRLVDRAFFLDVEDSSAAYRDAPYLSQAGRPGKVHLSAPSMYSCVLEELKLRPGHRFLNIGSGSGYLNTMVGFLVGSNGHNHGVEYQPNIVAYSKDLLYKFLIDRPEVDAYDFGTPVYLYGNAFALCGAAPWYDRIYIGAAIQSTEVAAFSSLLAEDGILIAPVVYGQENDDQRISRLMRFTRKAAGLEEETLKAVSFADLVADTALTEAEQAVRTAAEIKAGLDEEYRVPLAERLASLQSPHSLFFLCTNAVRSQIRDELQSTHPTAVRIAWPPTTEADGGQIHRRRNILQHIPNEVRQRINNRRDAARRAAEDEMIRHGRERRDRVERNRRQARIPENETPMQRILRLQAQREAELRARRRREEESDDPVASANMDVHRVLMALHAEMREGRAVPASVHVRIDPRTGRTRVLREGDEMREAELEIGNEAERAEDETMTSEDDENVDEEGRRERPVRRRGDADDARRRSGGVEPGPSQSRRRPHPPSSSSSSSSPSIQPLVRRQGRAVISDEEGEAEGPAPMEIDVRNGLAADDQMPTEPAVPTSRRVVRDSESDTDDDMDIGRFLRVQVTPQRARHIANDTDSSSPLGEEAEAEIAAQRAHVARFARHLAISREGRRTNPFFRTSSESSEEDDTGMEEGNEQAETELQRRQRVRQEAIDEDQRNVNETLDRALAARVEREERQLGSYWTGPAEVDGSLLRPAAEMAVIIELRSRIALNESSAGRDAQPDNIAARNSRLTVLRRALEQARSRHPIFLLIQHIRKILNDIPADRVEPSDVEMERRNDLRREESLLSEALEFAPRQRRGAIVDEAMSDVEGETPREAARGWFQHRMLLRALQDIKGRFGSIEEFYARVKTVIAHFREHGTAPPPADNETPPQRRPIVGARGPPPRFVMMMNDVDGEPVVRRVPLEMALNELRQGAPMPEDPRRPRGEPAVFADADVGINHHLAMGLLPDWAPATTGAAQWALDRGHIPSSTASLEDSRLAGAVWSPPKLRDNLQLRLHRDAQEPAVPSIGPPPLSRDIASRLANSDLDLFPPMSDPGPRPQTRCAEDFMQWKKLCEAFKMQQTAEARVLAWGQAQYADYQRWRSGEKDDATIAEKVYFSLLSHRRDSTLAPGRWTVSPRTQTASLVRFQQMLMERVAVLDGASAFVRMAIVYGRRFPQRPRVSTPATEEQKKEEMMDLN